MKKLITILALVAATVMPAMAQRHGGGPRGGNPEAQQAQADEAKAKMEAEARAYYADADTADYGVRYRMKYLYNKERNMTFQEDRVVLVTPGVTLDMSYEGIGESRWKKANNGQPGGDPTLAYRLTPDYYFFYPESGRQVRTYRILADEFLLNEGTCANKWTLVNEEKQIGDYICYKATLDKGGRQWTAWYTTALEGVAAPRDFNGLPGVIIELSDADNEVSWTFDSLVENLPDDTLHIKYPDTFAKATPEEFRKILELFALTDNNNLQSSGVLNKYSGTYPVKYRPSTGLDACLIDNPIER